MIRLKQSARKLVAAAALMMAILAALPSVVEAQDTANVPAQGNADNLSTTGITSQPAFEPAMGAIVTVKAGDSLWSIGQERLGPETTPAQITDEVERISKANRDLIGDDPNLILPGQELLLPTAAEPATSEPATSEPATEESVASGPIPEGSAASDSTTNEPVASESADATPSVKPVLEIPARQLLGAGIIALTMIVALLIAWKLPMRRVAKGTGWGMAVEYPNHRYPLPTLSPEGNLDGSKYNSPSNGHSPERVGVAAGSGDKRKGIGRSRKPNPRSRGPSRGWAVGAHDPQVRRFLKRVPGTRASELVVTKG